MVNEISTIFVWQIKGASVANVGSRDGALASHEPVARVPEHGVICVLQMGGLSYFLMQLTFLDSRKTIILVTHKKDYIVFLLEKI